MVHLVRRYYDFIMSFDTLFEYTCIIALRLVYYNCLCVFIIVLQFLYVKCILNQF